MSSKLFHHSAATAALLFTTVACPSRTSQVYAEAASANELLTERTEQSLRGQSVDLDDHWSSARLLAHFGESAVAFQVLKGRPEGDVLDIQIERFEARLLTEMRRPARADSILALQSYTGDDDAYYRLCLRRARLNLDAGRPQRARDFLSLIDPQGNSSFGPYRDYLEVEALLRSEELQEAWQVGERRLALGIPVSLSPHLEQLQLDAYVRAGRLDKALELVRVLKKRRERSSKLAPLLVREVDILFQMGDTLSAVQTAVDFLTDPRTRSEAVEVATRVVRSVPAGNIDDGQMLDLCGVLLTAEDLEWADRIIGELSRRALSHEQREKLRLFSGNLYYQERRYSKSYGFVKDSFSEPSFERDALLFRARIYRKTGQPVRSADTYVEFGRRFPYDAKAAEALLVGSELYLMAADRKQSLKTLERIVDIYPSNRHGQVATMRLALYYLERKHYSRGIEILERALNRTGRTSEELLYYLAQAYGDMGKKEKQALLLAELKQVDQKSFYLSPEVNNSFQHPIISSDGRVAVAGDRGLLAFLKMVFDKREAAMGDVRAALEPLPLDQSALDASSPYLRRGRYFLQMGFRDWAEEELRVLEMGDGLSPRVWFELGVLYDDFAMHWKSVRAFQRVYYSFDRSTRHSLQAQFDLLMYPLPYPAQVIENCARYNMPPHLAYAMMREESSFDYNAVSRAGAMGLMQLMPATGEQVAEELGFPDVVDDRLFTPEINLTFGIWYASHLLRRTDGNAPMMLCAYNAGLGNARRWFRSAPSTIDAVDGIGYRETRGYVKRIVESARVYHTYYFDHQAAGAPGR